MTVGARLCRSNKGKYANHSPCRVTSSRGMKSNRKERKILCTLASISVVKIPARAATDGIAACRVSKETNSYADC